MHHFAAQRDVVVYLAVQFYRTAAAVDVQLGYVVMSYFGELVVLALGELGEYTERAAIEFFRMVSLRLL